MTTPPMPLHVTHPNEIYRTNFTKVTNSILQTPQVSYSVEISASASKYFRKPGLKLIIFILVESSFSTKFQCLTCHIMADMLVKSFSICFIEG